MAGLFGSSEHPAPAGAGSWIVQDPVLPIVCRQCHGAHRRQRSLLEANPRFCCPSCGGVTDVASLLAEIPRNVLLETPRRLNRGRSEFP